MRDGSLGDTDENSPRRKGSAEARRSWRIDVEEVIFAWQVYSKCGTIEETCGVSLYIYDNKIIKSRRTNSDLEVDSRMVKNVAGR